MARGWESKAVEDQQRDARARLQLARTRALADLQQACAPAHRAMLEAAIRDLDEKIRAV